MVTLAGGLAVGGLIEQFEDTLAAVVVLGIHAARNGHGQQRRDPVDNHFRQGGSRWGI
jgi:hypothetical protein